jgi:putative aldouronate transport system permease protein
MVKLLPMGVNLDVYKIIFKSEKIWNAYKNTMIYTVSGTAINLIMTSLCAYPLSRKEFYGRKFFTVFVTMTMFIGGGMIPLYLVVDNLKLTNSIWAIVLPGAISTYNMIVMRTSFEAIPISLTESAYIDGANDLQILRKIVIPL